MSICLYSSRENPTLHCTFPYRRTRRVRSRQIQARAKSMFFSVISSPLYIRRLQPQCHNAMFGEIDATLLFCARLHPRETPHGLPRTRAQHFPALVFRLLEKPKGFKAENDPVTKLRMRSPSLVLITSTSSSIVADCTHPLGQPSLQKTDLHIKVQV
jgi:hypothetical protein